MSALARMLRAILIWAVIVLVLLSGWGWGQVASFMDQWQRALLLPTWLVLSIYGACRDTRTSTSGGKKEIRWHRQFLWLVVPLTIGWFIYLPYADRHHIGTVSNDAVRWAGLILFATAWLFRIEAIRAQGKQFSLAVAIQEEHKLATTGPYRLIRHPAYTGAITFVLGLSLIFANVGVGLIITVLVWLWMEMRIVDEERLLLDEFGEEYAIYRKRTAKLLPFVY